MSVGVILDTGEGRWAIPAEAVREIRDFEPPLPLPRSAPWLLGILVAGEEAVPVADPSFLFGGTSPPAVLVVLQREGIPLALPGLGASLVSLPAEGGDPSEGAARDGARLVDVERLYRACGLR